MHVQKVNDETGFFIGRFFGDFHAPPCGATRSLANQQIPRAVEVGHVNIKIWGSLQNSQKSNFTRKTQQNTIQWCPMLHFFRSIQDLWSFDPRILSEASHWSAPSAPAEPRSLPYVVGVGTPGTPICHFKRFKAYTVYRNRFCSSLHINIILQNWLLMLQRLRALPTQLNTWYKRSQYVSICWSRTRDWRFHTSSWTMVNSIHSFGMFQPLQQIKHQDAVFLQPPTATSRLLFCFFGSCFLGFFRGAGLSLGLVDGWNVQPGTLGDCSLSAFFLTPSNSRGCNEEIQDFSLLRQTIWIFISSLKTIEDLFQWGASCDTSGVFGASFAGGLSCMTCQSGMQPQKASVAAKKRAPYGGDFSNIGWCLWIYLGIGSRTKAIS